MEIKLAYLSLAAFMFASCDKSGNNSDSDSTPSNKSQIENRADAPANPPKPAHETSDPTTGHPADPATTRPAETAPANGPSDPLTAEQTIAKYKSDGIPGIPRQVSDKILADAAKTESNDDQLNIITRQTTAWRHINTFRENDGPIPEHMRRMLLERLETKHGDSWIDIVPELDEQIAANVKVDQLRANGIPGMSEDESQNLIIDAIGKYGPDYKAILSVAEQAAKK